MPSVPPKLDATDATAKCDDAHTIAPRQTRDKKESNTANATTKIVVATTVTNATESRCCHQSCVAVTAKSQWLLRNAQ